MLKRNYKLSKETPGFVQMNKNQRQSGNAAKASRVENIDLTMRMLSGVMFKLKSTMRFFCINQGQHTSITAMTSSESVQDTNLGVVFLHAEQKLLQLLQQKRETFVEVIRS